MHRGSGNKRLNPLGLFYHSTLIIRLYKRPEDMNPTGGTYASGRKSANDFGEAMENASGLMDDVLFIPDRNGDNADAWKTVLDRDETFSVVPSKPIPETLTAIPLDDEYQPVPVSPLVQPLQGDQPKMPSIAAPHSRIEQWNDFSKELILMLNTLRPIEFLGWWVLLACIDFRLQFPISRILLGIGGNFFNFFYAVHVSPLTAIRRTLDVSFVTVILYSLWATVLPGQDQVCA
jgi:hypothetical protein